MWALSYLWTQERQRIYLLAGGAVSKPHLAQFPIQGRLKLLKVSRGRTVSLFLWKQSKPARLIEIPLSTFAIAEGDFAADHSAWPRNLIDVHRNRARSCATRGAAAG